MSLEFAPWDNPHWCLIAHPCCRQRCRREPDWYHDMHCRANFADEHKGWNQKYYTWLKRLTTPIFMQEQWPEIPMSVRYPLEMIEAEFASSMGSLYATNHCCYMIALAMAEGVETIGLFGCQYSGTDRGSQRDGLFYWMGRFEQAGGKLVIPRKYNTLLDMPLYGYASHDRETGKLTGPYLPDLAVPGRIEQKTGAPLKLTIIDSLAGVVLAKPPQDIAVAYDAAEQYYGLTLQEKEETSHAVPEGPQAIQQEISTDGIVAGTAAPGTNGSGAAPRRHAAKNGPRRVPRSRRSRIHAHEKGHANRQSLRSLQ